MEVSELATMVNDRFDKLDERIKELHEAREKFSDECRVRHTDIDKDITSLRERQGIIGVIIVTISTAVAGAISYLRG